MRFFKIFIIWMIVSIGGTFALPNTISQVEKNSIKIDGDLKEWEQGKWFPVTETIGETAHKPSTALDVKTAFAFDDEHFYLAVRAFDDVFETVNRSWRYGDGFFFTLVADKGTDRSADVYQYGFSKKEKPLVFGSGEYFPNFSTRDIDVKFKQFPDRVDYEIAIPFRLLKPFNPFYYEKVALNLIYTDRDGDKSRVVMLMADPDYDTERTDRRGGRFFQLKPSVPGTAAGNSCHFYLKKNFLKTGEDFVIGYALNVDKSYRQWRIKAKLIFEEEEKQKTGKSISLQKGLNTGSLSFRIKDLPMSHYELRLQVQDSGGKETGNYFDYIYVLNEREIAGYKDKMARYNERGAIATSLTNLQIRFEWFDDFYKKENYREIAPLLSYHRDILYLIDKLEKGKPALFGKGMLKRYAHRSKIDGTLQPYSVFMPSTFRSDKKYPLIVALHGSGVDERSFVGFFAGRLGILGYPMLAPKARGLSDYYVGDSGKDVFECIEHFLSLYPNIDREMIFLGGFSMGGYGALRLGLKRPNYFKGLMILSGVLVPPGETGGENLVDMVDRIKDENLLIIHGDKDNAVPIDNTRKAVAKLKASNAKLTYIEIPGAGHGNYNKYREIIDWLKKLCE